MRDLYATGATLQEVGERFGLSRERVRQIFQEADLPTRTITETHALRHDRLLERADEVIAAYEQLKDAGQVARKLDIPRAVVKEIVAERFPTPEKPRWRRRGPVKRKYSTDEMIAFLKQAVTEVQDRLSLGAYQRYAQGRHTSDGRPWPSIHTYNARFGSWRKALIAADLPVSPHGPSGAKRRFSDQDCIDALRNVSQILGEAPTITAYNEIARASNSKLPSSATIASRLGSWYDALTRAGL